MSHMGWESIVLITHCHADGHLFIQEECHVSLVTTFHPFWGGHSPHVLLCLYQGWHHVVYYSLVFHSFF